MFGPKFPPLGAQRRGAVSPSISPRAGMDLNFSNNMSQFNHLHYMPDGSKGDTVYSDATSISSLRTMRHGGAGRCRLIWRWRWRWRRARRLAVRRDAHLRGAAPGRSTSGSPKCSTTGVRAPRSSAPACEERPGGRWRLCAALHGLPMGSFLSDAVYPGQGEHQGGSRLRLSHWFPAAMPHRGRQSQGPYVSRAAGPCLTIPTALTGVAVSGQGRRHNGHRPHASTMT